MNTTLTMITRDPFCHPWKRARAVLDEVARRGWPTSLAVDERSCLSCKRMMTQYGDPLFFTPAYDSCDGMMNEVVERATTRHCLMISDDEEPSAGVWKLAARPGPFSYAFRLLCPLPNGRLYTPGTEIQMRLVERDGWRLVGGIDGWDDTKRPASSSEIIWHFACFAPRAFRDAKFEGYARATGRPANEWEIRHNWEDHLELSERMTPELVAQMPRGEVLV